MKRILFLFFTFFLSGAIAQLPVVIHEKFDVNTYGWFENTTDKGKVEFRNGKYFMDAPEGGWMSIIAPYLEQEKDFSIETTFTQLDGNSDNGLGIIWGYDGVEPLNSFIFTSGGYYRIWSSDRSLGISDAWVPTSVIKPMGEPNTLKIAQTQGMMHFYLNGKHLTTTKRFSWPGAYIGFVAYTKMKLLIDDFIFSQDLSIRLPQSSVGPVVKENLGPGVNTIYDEVSPTISADGKILYFGRKSSPDNIGGVDDKEDIWQARSPDGKTWSRGVNMGRQVNTTSTNNLISVSTDNNTLMFHANDGFAFMHRTATGWSALEDLGIHFDNESGFLEGCLSPDGKAILFVARLKANAFYRADVEERDIYVCMKRADGTWSAPIHTGSVLNSTGDEYSPFLSADGKTLYFATNGRPGYGGVDIFMSRRLSDDWKHWSEPVNLGLGINTVGFDAYYTFPASGEYGYMVSNINTVGLTDIIRFKLPESVKPDPVVLVSGRVLNANTQQPLPAIIRFDDLKTGKEIGEARVNPKTGDYKIALAAGKDYGFHAAAAGYLSVNENLELVHLDEYAEIKKDLLLVPIEIGQSIQLRNVFFVQSKAELMNTSYPELDRLVKIMHDNPTIEIELSGHTDNLGSPIANLELSEQRVDAVESYLRAKGISPKRITGRGYGGSRPIAPSDTEENRQQNRRVEFKIVKK